MAGDPSTETPLYDVIIVGSGPAGGTAAYYLGEAGKQVLVLEKERLPRYKTCGGGLSLRFLSKQFPFSFESLVKHEVTAISYVFSKLELTIPISTGAIGCVMRSDLDYFLLSQSRADVEQECAVSKITELDDRVQVELKDGRCYCASYLIGADGANSTVARSLGLRNKRTMAAAIEVEVSAPQAVLQRFQGQMVFIFGEIPLGYLWIFAKAEHLSVGIGALHPGRGRLQKTLKKVMARYGIMVEDTVFHGHPIPIYTRRERVSTARTLLAGDAAGLADPLSGEGIRFAIKSGRLAAETILNGCIERYSKELDRSIRVSHSFTIWISLLFYIFQIPCLFFGTANPFTTQAMIEVLSDRITTLEFLLISIFTLPLFLGTEITAYLLKRFGRPLQSQRLRTSIYPVDVRACYQDE